VAVISGAMRLGGGEGKACYGSQHWRDSEE